MMKPMLFVFGGAAAAGAAFFLGAGLHDEEPEVSVARGKYIVNALACHDCHTRYALGPNGPEPDMAHALQGHPEEFLPPPPPKPPEGSPWIMQVAATNTAWAGPWGVSYTANLTPDVETGLGSWTEQEFVDTFRTGRRRGRGREILPPMPIAQLNNLTDADLKSVFAYLKSLPPAKNRVPLPTPPEAPTGPSPKDAAAPAPPKRAS